MKSLSEEYNIEDKITLRKGFDQALICFKKYVILIKEISKISDTIDSVRIYKIQGKGIVEVFGK